MSEQPQAEPRQRFEVERDRHGLMCSRPVEVGECVGVRIDRATEADIEAVSMRLADIAPDGDMFSRKAWCEEKARHILATVFSEVADA